MNLHVTHLTRQSPARQSGIVLALMLVLLAVTSLVGALSMRNATLTEQTTNSLRTAAVAQQAAEMALKYCELVAQDINGTIYSTERGKIGNTVTGVLSSGAWNTTSTWSSSATYIEVPSSFANSADTAAITFKTRPHCVIQPINNTTGTGYVVTGRGFGNDAVLNANNGVTSGSEAWVQSVLMR
jgi:type IV pilus assembly protein PilX